MTWRWCEGRGREEGSEEVEDRVGDGCCVLIFLHESQAFVNELDWDIWLIAACSLATSPISSCEWWIGMVAKAWRTLCVFEAGLTSSWELDQMISSGLVQPTLFYEPKINYQILVFSCVVISYAHGQLCSRGALSHQIWWDYVNKRFPWPKGYVDLR